MKFQFLPEDIFNKVIPNGLGDVMQIFLSQLRNLRFCQVHLLQVILGHTHQWHELVWGTAHFWEAQVNRLPHPQPILPLHHFVQQYQRKGCLVRNGKLLEALKHFVFQFQNLLWVSHSPFLVHGSSSDVGTESSHTPYSAWYMGSDSMVFLSDSKSTSRVMGVSAVGYSSSTCTRLSGGRVRAWACRSRSRSCSSGVRGSSWISINRVCGDKGKSGVAVTPNCAMSRSENISFCRGSSRALSCSFCLRVRVSTNSPVNISCCSGLSALLIQFTHCPDPSILIAQKPVYARLSQVFKLAKSPILVG